MESKTLAPLSPSATSLPLRGCALGLVGGLGLLLPSWSSARGQAGRHEAWVPVAHFSLRAYFHQLCMRLPCSHAAEPGGHPLPTCGVVAALLGDDALGGGVAPPHLRANRRSEAGIERVSCAAAAPRVPAPPQAGLQAGRRPPPCPGCLPSLSCLHDGHLARQQAVHRVLHPVRDPVRALPHLNHEREGGRRLALQHALLGAARPSLVIACRAAKGQQAGAGGVSQGPGGTGEPQGGPPPPPPPRVAGPEGSTGQTRARQQQRQAKPHRRAAVCCPSSTLTPRLPFSPSVTEQMPPTRSDSVGFLIRFSSSWPWAVPISCVVSMGWVARCQERCAASPGHVLSWAPRGLHACRAACQPAHLHAALGDGAAGQRLCLRADLIDNHDLGHVVLQEIEGTKGCTSECSIQDVHLCMPDGRTSSARPYSTD